MEGIFGKSKKKKVVRRKKAPVARTRVSSVTRLKRELKSARTKLAKVKRAVK